MNRSLSCIFLIIIIIIIITNTNTTIDLVRRLQIERRRITMSGSSY